MNRALIIGCPGSGKSVFARKLRDKTGLPLYHLDRIYWRSDRTCVSKAAFDERLRDLLQRDAWIIDGNYARTLPMRMARCDAVFFLDYPMELCLEGIAQRRGSALEDMPWVEAEEDPQLTAFVRGFERDVRPAIVQCIERTKGVEVYWFRGRADADDYFTL